MNSELKTEVSNRVNHLGDAEFQLAYSKAESKDVKTLEALVSEFRKPFLQGRVTDNGYAAFATEEVWRDIAEQSEKAARAELVKNSALLSELTELERVAAQAKRIADPKERELNTLWNEYQRLPNAIDALERRITDLNSELSSLETSKLEAEFKRMYRETLEGATNDRLGQALAAGLLVTAPLRREVLNALIDKGQTELIELKTQLKSITKMAGAQIDITPYKTSKL